MALLILATTLLLSLCGIFICTLITMRLMNRNNPLTEKLCSADGKFDCDKVLSSGLGKVSKHIHLGDLAWVYFTAQSLFLIFESINRRTSAYISIITLPCLLALALTFISLIYQGFIIKAWCKMCLMVTGVVWLQTIVLALNFILHNNSEKLLPSLLMFIASLLIASSWFFIKNTLTIAGEVNIVKRKLFLFKKDANIFRAVLRKQRVANTTLWEDEFLLGSRAAPTQFVVALNPYCVPCAMEYARLQDLFNTFPGAICIAIRFLAVTSTENRSTQATRYLLRQYETTSPDKHARILETWFSSLSFTDLQHEHPAQETRLDHLLQKHEKWFEENKITHTPTLFINGHEFPRLYTIPDLLLLIPRFTRRPLKAAVLK